MKQLINKFIFGSLFVLAVVLVPAYNADASVIAVDGTITPLDPNDLTGGGGSIDQTLESCGLGTFCFDLTKTAGLVYEINGNIPTVTSELIITINLNKASYTPGEKMGVNVLAAFPDPGSSTMPADVFIVGQVANKDNASDPYLKTMFLNQSMNQAHAIFNYVELTRVYDPNDFMAIPQIPNKPGSYELSYGTLTRRMISGDAIGLLQRSQSGIPFTVALEPVAACTTACSGTYALTNMIGPSESFNYSCDIDSMGAGGTGATVSINSTVFAPGGEIIITGTEPVGGFISNQCKSVPVLVKGPNDTSYSSNLHVPSDTLRFTAPTTPGTYSIRFGTPGATGFQSKEGAGSEMIVYRYEDSFTYTVLSNSCASITSSSQCVAKTGCNWNNACDVCANPCSGTYSASNSGAVPANLLIQDSFNYNFTLNTGSVPTDINSTVTINQKGFLPNGAITIHASSTGYQGTADQLNIKVKSPLSTVYDNILGIVDNTLNLTAPSTPGDYTIDFGMPNGNGGFDYSYNFKISVIGPDQNSCRVFSSSSSCTAQTGCSWNNACNQEVSVEIFAYGKNPPTVKSNPLSIPNNTGVDIFWSSSKNATQCVCSYGDNISCTPVDELGKITSGIGILVEAKDNPYTLTESKTFKVVCTDDQISSPSTNNTPSTSTPTPPPSGNTPSAGGSDAPTGGGPAAPDPLTNDGGPALDKNQDASQSN